MARLTGAHPRPGSSELGAVLRASRTALLGVSLMTAGINLLYLTGSFFMLEVYDRVIPSRSVPTLVGLCALALLLYAFQGALDAVRSRVLVRIGSAFDEAVSGRVFDVVVRLPLRGPSSGDGLLPLRDLDSIRGFLSGMGPTALFDLPWMPLYLGICFLFHPALGAMALGGAVLLVALTLLTDLLTRGPTRRAAEQAGRRNSLAEAGRRNAEVLAALGMGRRLGARWAEANAQAIAAQGETSDVAGGIGGVTKVLRMVLQSGVLALGAYLVIQGSATAGIMIASSILTSRALAPVELAIANWRSFVAARQSWRRLKELLAALPPAEEPMALPRPRERLSVERVSAAPPGVNRLVVQDVGFTLQAGQALGVIGPSASGKSSLARVLAGVWRPVRGSVCLDGAALDQWSPEALGGHLGYLPQDVELFAGTVAENISRFDPQADPEAVIKAAQAAGVHDLILGLSDGYDTAIGEAGAALSAGQRQRVALARALYGDTFLVILDEPNSNLDADGEAALTQAVLGVRARGGIVVLIAHRPAALAAVDMVLMMRDGRAQAFGPKDEILSKVLRPAPVRAPAAAAAGGNAVAAPAGSLRVVADKVGEAG